MQRDNLMATAWYAKRTVFVLSTNWVTLERRKKSSVVVEVPWPLSVKNYTQYMNGVDHHDKLRSVYGISSKSLKWWKYVLCNSYIIICESHTMCWRDVRTCRTKKPVGVHDGSSPFAVEWFQNEKKGHATTCAGCSIFI